MIRLLFVPVAMLAGLFLVVLGLAFAATIVGAPIGLALIAAGARIAWL